jgi:hypothetical protein
LWLRGGRELKTEFPLNITVEFSSYLTGNARYLRYKDQSIEAAVREHVAVYCENHMEHPNILRAHNAEFFMLKDVVHILTTGL